MIKGIIFDCDGVLIDSETVHQAHHNAFAKYYGYDIKKEDFLKFIGGNPKLNFWHWIWEESNIQVPYEKFIEDRDEYTRMFPIAKDYELIPHVKELIYSLKDKGFKLAVASSSPLSYVIHNLLIHDLIESVDAINTGRNLKESKPNPTIYLNTMNDLGITNDECIIVEDSPYGILAGKNAGCYVIARRDFRYSLDQDNADIIVDDMLDVEKIVMNKNI